MTAPLRLSAQYDDNASTPLLYVIFDRAISGTAGLGWSLVKSPGGPVVPLSATIVDTAVVFELPAVVGAATLLVAYDDGPGNLVEAAAPNDSVASFSGYATAYPVLGQILRAQAGVAANDSVTVFFGEPVAATTGDLITGFTITSNGQPVDLTGASASLNAAQTELTIDTGVNFTYNDVVDVAYSASTGGLVTYPTGTVPGILLTGIQNLATDGLPNSDYPLSYVIAVPVEMCNKVATGQLSVALNPIDNELVSRYGPVTVITGGTFGTTLSNPAGITVLGQTVTITDGVQITQNFTSPTVSWASDAALDWQTAITSRIGIALGQLRSIDQSVVLGTRTITQV